MKKNILFLLMSLVCSAHAQDRGACGEKQFCVDPAHFYTRLLGGANFLHNSTTDGNKATFKPGYIIDTSLGYYWSCGLYLEGEFAFRRNAINKIDFFIEGCSSCGHFQSFSFMANLLWDLPLCSRRYAFRNFQPFVGIGLGYDFQQMHSSNSRVIFDQKWNSLAWQAMAGLTYPVCCNTDIILEYKFHQGGRYFYNNSVGIWLVYTF